MAPPPAHGTPRTWARAAAALSIVYGLVLVVVFFTPSSGTQMSMVVKVIDLTRLVLPDDSMTYARGEVVMNAFLVAPLSFLGSFAWRRLRWQDWTTYGFLGACAIEVTQGAVLPHRVASFSDVVANTAGMLLGSVVASALVLATRRLSRPEAGSEVRHHPSSD